MIFVSEFQHKAATLWQTQRIKRMVREIGGLGPHTLVSVTEISCDDPACPGPAIQITIFGIHMMRRVFVIHRAAAEVSAADLGMINE